MSSGGVKPPVRPNSAKSFDARSIQRIRSCSSARSTIRIRCVFPPTWKRMKLPTTEETSGVRVMNAWNDLSGPSGIWSFPASPGFSTRLSGEAPTTRHAIVRSAFGSV